MISPSDNIEDRIYGMREAAKLVGASNVRTFRETLQSAHREKGNIMTCVRKHWYVTHSALRTLFPQIFSNTKSKVDDRFDVLEHHIEKLEGKLIETNKQLYSARVRIRQLEDRIRPGKAPRGDD